MENVSNLNATKEPEYEDSEPNILFLTYYYGTLLVLSVICIIGNGLVICSIVRHPALRIPSYYFIFSLACSDLLLGFVYPIYNIAHLQKENIKEAFGDWHVCTFIITITLGLLSVSSFNLVGIITFRFLSVKYPLTFTINLTHAKALAATIGVWVGMLLLSVAFFLRPEPPRDEEYEYYCRYEEVLTMRHIMFSSVISYFIPVSLMAPMYAFMMIQARKQSKRIANLAYNPPITFQNNDLDTTERQRRYRNQNNRADLKMFKMATLLFGYFTLSWIPVTIYLLSYVGHHYDVESNYTPANDYVRATVRILLHSNSAVNVWIYAGRLQEFRNSFHKDCLALPCCKANICKRCCDKEGRRRLSGEWTNQSTRSFRTNVTDTAVTSGGGRAGVNSSKSPNIDSGMASESGPCSEKDTTSSNKCTDKNADKETLEKVENLQNVPVHVVAQSLAEETALNEAKQHAPEWHREHVRFGSRGRSQSLQTLHNTVEQSFTASASFYSTSDLRVEDILTIDDIV